MSRKLILLMTPLALVSAFAPLAHANAQILGTCLVDSLNGKERKQLAKWIYFALAAHPDLKSYSNISSEDRIETDRGVGSLITRLLAEDCATELKEAKNTDPLAMQRAFEMVGRVAMQELMTNQEVTAATSDFSRYVDQEKINEALVEK